MFDKLKKLGFIERLTRSFKKRDLRSYLEHRGARLDPTAFIGADLRVIQRQWAFLLEMERGSAIGAGSTVILHDSAATILGGLPTIKYGRVVLRRFACVGAGSILLPGVEIGAYSLVAAGSVVTRSVAPRTVHAGNPARFVCTLEEWARRLRMIEKNPGPHDLFIDGHFPEGFEAWRETYLAGREKTRPLEEANQAALWAGLPRSNETARAAVASGDPNAVGRLQDFISTRFLSGEAVEPDEPLFSAGLLDSLALAEVVTFVEEAFGIPIPPEERRFEAFDSIRAVVALVEERKRRKGPVMK